jgi:hypothetical protein
MNRIKYNSLSIEQKRNICTYNEKNKGIKQKQLIIYFTKIEACLNIWLCSKVTLNIPISYVILREKAKDFCDLYRSDERYKKKLEDSDIISDIVSDILKSFKQIKLYCEHQRQTQSEHLDVVNQLEDIIMNFVHLNMRQKPIDSYLIKN